jgi:hypothetical protein
VLPLGSAAQFVPWKKYIAPFLGFEPEIYDVKPQDIGAVCGVSAMPTKWAKCSDVAGNERILAASVNYSQSYPQKLWNDGLATYEQLILSTKRLFLRSPFVWHPAEGLTKGNVR